MRLSLLILFFFGYGRFAQAQGIGPAPLGARAQALGGAATTLGGEVWAAANNPAGLGTLTQPTAGAYLENRYLIPSLNVAAAALALPLGPVEAATAGQPARAARGVLALGGQRFGGALYSEARVGAAYGYRLGVVSVGGRLDVLQVRLQDLGSRLAPVVSLAGQAELLPGHLTLGAYLYNLTQARLATYQDERMPTLLRAGLAYRPSAQVLLLAEAEKDVEHPAGLRTGIEYQPAAAVAVRLGYASGSEQATAGAGVHLGGFHFDYAAGWHAVLGLSQFMSVHWQWARTEKQPADNE